MEDSEGNNELIECDEKLTNDVVKAIFLLDHSKKPFKAADIIALLNCKPSRKQWVTVFDKAKQKIRGLGLVLNEANNKSSKVFFLTSINTPLPLMCRYASDNEKANRTLLVLVLTYIFMKEKSVSEGEQSNYSTQYLFRGTMTMMKAFIMNNY